MIRDPSDGSVRETPKADMQIHRPKTEVGIPVSGLPPASTKPQMIAKLEKSREWLKNYHGRKEK
jgi:hypothetical protein